MFRIGLITLFFSFCLSFHAQQNFKLISSFNQEIDNVYMDNLEFLYFQKSNELIKLNLKGDTLFQFSNKLLGNISEVDVYNTLRPVIYSQETAGLIVTDNTLSPQHEIYDISQLDLYQASLIASSKFDNGIWLYDRELFQLIKVNTSFERTYASGNLEQILMMEAIDPIQLLEYGRNVYMVSRNYGILQFDIYGNYIKTIPIEQIDWIQVMDEKILFKKGGAFYVYSFMSFETEPFPIPTGDAEKVLISGKLMIILSKNTVYVYEK